jgi:hypothetical protein
MEKRFESAGPFSVRKKHKAGDENERRSAKG